MTDSVELQEIRDLLRALVALAIDERETRLTETPIHTKSEVLLSEAGLSTPMIAAVMNKKSDAVRKAISRARSKNTSVIKAE